MTERHSQKHSLLFAIFLLLSTTAASPQLADGAMRSRPRDSLPQSCRSVLQRPVAGCTAVEFEARRGCSRACARGLLTTQAALRGACRGAPPDLSTFVDAALDGDLVRAVCGWVEDDDDDDKYETSRVSTTMATTTTTTRRVESSSPPGSSTPTPVATPSTPPDGDDTPRNTSAPQPTEEAGDEAGDGNEGTPADDGVDPFSVFRGGSAGRLVGGLGHAAAVACCALFLLVR